MSLLNSSSGTMLTRTLYLRSLGHVCLLGVCLQFLDRRFGFFNFLFQSRGAVSVIARSLVGDVVFPSFSVASFSHQRELQKTSEYLQGRK